MGKPLNLIITQLFYLTYGYVDDIEIIVNEHDFFVGRIKYLHDKKNNKYYSVDKIAFFKTK